LTVAVPSPDEMCDPFSDDCNSSPRYLIEVISQLFALTVKMRGLDAPVSTTMLSPLCEAPKAASAEGESVAAANSALLNNMARDEGFETIDQQNGQ
jgi:hypothetical protein